MTPDGTIKRPAITRKQNPLKLNRWTEIGYNELKMAAPNSVHNVSNIATAANNAPKQLKGHIYEEVYYYSVLFNPISKKK